MVEGPVQAEFKEFTIHHSPCIQTLSQLSFFFLENKKRKLEPVPEQRQERRKRSRGAPSARCRCINQKVPQEFLDIITEHKLVAMEENNQEVLSALLSLNLV